MGGLRKQHAGAIEQLQGQQGAALEALKQQHGQELEEVQKHSRKALKAAARRSSQAHHQVSFMSITPYKSFVWCRCIFAGKHIIQGLGRLMDIVQSHLLVREQSRACQPACLSLLWETPCVLRSVVQEPHPVSLQLPLTLAADQTSGWS